jgi:hypothetical protein
VEWSDFLDFDGDRACCQPHRTPRILPLSPLSGFDQSVEYSAIEAMGMTDIEL